MKYVSPFFQVLLFAAAIAFSFYSLQPSINKASNNTHFSVDKALVHVKQIAKEPHYTGSNAHAVVRNYLVSALEDLGLEPHLQQGFSTTYFKGLSIAIPENIVAKIHGKNPEAPALVLMSHYDSSIHSSFGASDAASGVAAILESARAFLAQNQQPNQDVIILFSDTEEVGLNGANLFVKEHPWAKNIGLALNFEARGSAGPSPMVLEVNGGNKHLITHFANADVSSPFANSLMYSIYKLLPNNTDSTVFREEANIPGYFFAFIDNYFNYHTALDTPENLDINSLNQQGVYALSLLNYFSSTSLTNLVSKSDHVYFNFPMIGMIHFSMRMVLFLIVFCFFGLIILTYIGVQKNKIHLKSIVKSFFFTTASLAFAFLIGFYGWKLISYFYPEYDLILHGFPYNGLSYVLAFLCLTIALFLRFFYSYSKNNDALSFAPVPIFFWTILSFSAYLYLPGASYFIIPALCGLFMFAGLVLLKTNNQLLHFLLSLPMLFLIVPFVYFLPVGLGISSIYIACVLSVLILLLVSPLLYNFNSLKGVSFLLFCASFFFFGKAHINADFNASQPRPSSLVYCQDKDADNSFWASYDSELSNWNSSFFATEAETKMQLNFESKYANSFNHVALAENISLPKSKVEIQELNRTEKQRTFKLFLKPERNINRYEIFFNKPISFSDIIVKGKPINLNLKNGILFRNTRFLNYYVANHEALEIEFTVHTTESFELKVFESAYDLIDHPTLKVAKRPRVEIPMAFVLSDATIVTYTIPVL